MQSRCVGSEPIKPTSWSFEPKTCESNVPDCAFCQELNAFLVQPDKIEEVFSKNSYRHIKDQLDGEYGDVYCAPGGTARVIKQHREWRREHHQWKTKFDAVYKSLPVGKAVKDLLGDKYDELIEMSWLELNAPEWDVEG